jgi:hypothetical protein
MAMNGLDDGCTGKLYISPSHVKEIGFPETVRIPGADPDLVTIFAKD